ncbi:MAG: hypothetical protein PHN84_01335 [Desulfuromonadaceae bacterium]|nr:hypothetical protein [Desulfuromonadaceae bacterium]MDD2854845.1 hypothetical protein [Desulfuromonadaceae bacterium]
MKKQIFTTVAVVGLLVAVAAGDVLAAGKGGNGKRNGTCVSTQSANGTSTAVTRPAGSQRRDGTFLATGVTANGSTTRQGKGKGLMDGSGLAATAPVAATTAETTNP